jgi:hypothetical protein
MTQKERELLLKDLSARLPYGVIVKENDGVMENDNKLLDIDMFDGCINYDYIIEDIKPYLRPMSSITEEEKKELKSATCPEGTGYFDEQYLICPMSHFGEHISYDFMSDILNWLNAHHFDYRGLIEKVLALEAPEDMYKTE